MTIRCQTKKVTDVYLNGKPLNKVYCNGVLVFSVIACWQSAEVYLTSAGEVGIRVYDIDNMMASYSGSDFTVRFRLFENGERVYFEEDEYGNPVVTEWDETPASPNSPSGNITFSTGHYPEYGATYSAEVQVLANNGYQGWSGTAEGSVIKPYTYVSKPAVRSRTYNGSTQYAFDASGYYTLSGGRVDAGQGTTTAWLKDGYAWSDGSTARYYSAYFTIAKATINRSSYFRTGQLATYDGKYHSAYTANDAFTVKPTASAVNAGEYTYYANLKDTANYQWDDGTTGEQTFNWSIAKATIATSAITVTISGSSGTPCKATVNCGVSGLSLEGYFRRVNKSTDAEKQNSVTGKTGSTISSTDFTSMNFNTYKYGFRVTKIYGGTNYNDWSGSVGAGSWYTG